MIYSENILLCIGIPLLVVCVFVRGNARNFVTGFIVGMAVCLLASYISGFLGLLAEISVNETAVYISPIVEEIMKQIGRAHV